ncbi:ANPRA protein, partial [Pseudoatta argentina]
MASRTRKRWCANGDVLVRLTLTLSGLCAGQCTNIGPMTMTTTTMTRVSTTETGTTMTAGSRECIGGVRTMQSKDEVKLAVIAPGDPHHEQSLQRVLPAVLLAVKYVSSPRGPLPGWNIKVDYRDSYCSSTYGPLAAFEFYINQTADAFLGPVCDYVIAPVARYAGVWGIPVLTAGAQAEAFRHKGQHYPTLTRMMGSHRLVGEALRHILRSFGWKICGLLFHNHEMASSKGNSECHFTLSAVYTALNQTPAHKSFNQETADTDEYKNLLSFIAKSARIIVMCANSTTIREILLAAEQLGMVDSGEYVFFSIELSSSDNDSKEPWRVDGDTDERNEKARKAYQALLTVTARTPDNLEYLNFSREVKSLAQRKYNFIFGNSSVSTFVTAFYDAVLLYALALKDSLPEKPGEVNLDGGNLTRKMWGKSFKGITGDVNIDENGDRIADYSLLDMDPETSRFEIVANYYGANKTLEYIPGKQIHWAGGRLEPPPDTPTCGFDGSLCPDNSLPGYAILSMVLSSIVVVLVVGSVFIYRRFKLEAEIASMTWKVHWDDVIVIPNAKTRGSMYSLIANKFRGSELTIYSEDNASLPDGVDRNVYVPTGFYKNSKVAIKLIPRNKVEISRPLLLELKRMKDLQHDHLVRFYGACLEPPHCCLLTEYCPKGSLQDILENEQIKLDRVFRGSLIHDIVRGMVYLHASEVKSHGNLKSSNCVVDSRFVLKIADFGLHELRRSVDVDSDGDKNSYAYWRKQLWTAPELLRMERQLPEGTQKGDVYSFAIIVHEIVMRQGPFYLGDNNELPPKGKRNSVTKLARTPRFNRLMASKGRKNVSNICRWIIIRCPSLGNTGKATLPDSSFITKARHIFNIKEKSIVSRAIGNRVLAQSLQAHGNYPRESIGMECVP